MGHRLIYQITVQIQTERMLYVTEIMILNYDFRLKNGTKFTWCRFRQ